MNFLPFKFVNPTTNETVNDIHDEGRANVVNFCIASATGYGAIYVYQRL